MNAITSIAFIAVIVIVAFSLTALIMVIIANAKAAGQGREKRKPPVCQTCLQGRKQGTGRPACKGAGRPPQHHSDAADFKRGA